MRKLFSGEAIELIPTDTGFVFVAKQQVDNDEKRMTVGYRMFDFDTMATRQITRSVYLLNKFGNNFSAFENDPNDFINSRTAFLPSQNVIMARYTGDSEIFNYNGESIKKCDLKYGNFAPYGITEYNGTVFVSYPDADSIVQYNTRTMKKMLRIGGDNLHVLRTPEGLWTVDDSILVCCSDMFQILKINLTDYSISTFMETKEPVHQYIKVRTHEIIMLNSGIYSI